MEQVYNLWKIEKKLVVLEYIRVNIIMEVEKIQSFEVPCDYIC